MIDRERLVIAGGVAVLAGAVILALAWAWAAIGSPVLGLDLLAYEAAADRLVDTGSPYSEELRAGPIANEPDNVPIGYFYPPPLAQVFTLVRGVDHVVLAATWAISQAALAFVVLPVVWRRSGGRAGLAPLLWLMAFAIGSYPFQLGLVVGNVSVWIALLVAAVLVTRPRQKGVLIGGLGLLKTTNTPLLLASLAERRSRWPALAVVALVCAASCLISPRAWIAWLELLPNILRLPPGDSPSSVSLASMFRYTPVAGTALLSSSIAGVAVGVTAIWLVRREGLSRRAVTAAVASALLLNPTLWDHYLAVMVPITIATWPNVSDRWRLVLVVASTSHLLGWAVALELLRASALFMGFVAVTLASLVGDVPADRRPRADSTVKIEIPGPLDSP
ncbi:MAG: glycosyltransferase family 87 protein [Chloroflexota bacterium]